MPTKIPLVRIGVSRNGATIYPEINKPFDFTKEELADLDRMNASDKNDYYRNPVNEGGDAEAVVPATKKPVKGSDAL